MCPIAMYCASVQLSTGRNLRGFKCFGDVLHRFVRRDRDARWERRDKRASLRPSRRAYDSHVGSIRAVAEVLARDRLNLRDVHHAIDRLRFEAGLPPPLSVLVTSDVRARTSVRTHALSTYDRLQSPKGEPDDDDAVF